MSPTAQPQLTKTAEQLKLTKQETVENNMRTNLPSPASKKKFP
jgi:hypothetical protein